MPRSSSRTPYLDLVNQDRRLSRQQAAAPRKAASKPSATPPRARPGYPRRRELERDLARYYERCKSQNAGRFQSGKRLKSYCSAVSWTVARRAGRYPDYPSFRRGRSRSSAAARPAAASRAKETPMPRRDAHGRFVSTRSKAKRASEASRRPHHVRGYSMVRRGKTVHVRPHQSREAAGRKAPRRRPHQVRGYSYFKPSLGKTVHVKGHRSREASGGKRRPHQVRGYSYVRRGKTVHVRPHYSREHGMVIVPMEASRPRARRSSHRRMYARETPRLTAGGLAILGIGGVLGIELANFAHRYVVTYDPNATPAPQLPAGISDVTTYNKLVVDAKPSWKSIAAQLGISVLGFGLGWYFTHPAVKLLTYGVGLGSLLHLGTQLLDAYVIEPMFTNTNAGARLYAHEYDVASQLGTASSSSSSSGTTSGPPQLSRRGTPIAASAPALPEGQRSRIPAALALGAPAPAATIAAIAAAPPAVLRQQPAAAASAPPANTVLPGPGVPPAAQGGGMPPSTSPECGCKGGAGEPPPAETPSAPVHPMFSSMFRDGTRAATPRRVA